MTALKRYLGAAMGSLIRRIGIRSVVFEVTQDCNQDCAFCYNVWKCADYPQGQLDTPRTLELIDRVVSTYRPQLITFSGGEPLMRPDIVELVRHASRRAHVNLITNGTLMTDGLARDLMGARVRTFEFTLLAVDREVHNSLVGRDSFDSVIEAIASVRAAGGVIAVTFVATRRNIDQWPETLELCAALGVSGILFNRYNVGGAGIRSAPDLMPTLDQLRTALAAADEGARRHGMGISCGVPVPPCLIDWSEFRNVHFTDCAVGTRNAYPTVDPLGNVRPCNHSKTVLGNAFESDMRSIVRSEASLSYSSGISSECDGCRFAKTCRGGCRAAAEVCGCPGGIDPAVAMLSEARGARCAGCA